MNEIKNTNIQNLIYEIRGKQVMLDSDLAKLYQCKNGTKEINQAVKNNLEKFPERFAFRITEKEYNLLKSNILTSNTKGGSRKGHTAFTEQGVAMLATILKTPYATQISIAIMDAFVSMKKYISTNLVEQKYINNMVLEHENEIKLLKNTFSSFNENTNHIFFEGQIYDAYSLLIDILNTASKNIIIIDNYIDKKFLDICSKIKENIIIVTKEIDKIDLEKYNKQYNNIKVRISNKYHDRFIILDNKVLYHSGASFKDLGKKCFCISKIENESILNNLLNLIN